MQFGVRDISFLHHSRRYPAPLRYHDELSASKPLRRDKSTHGRYSRLPRSHAHCTVYARLQLPELNILSTQRPFLALCLSLASPAVWPTRPFQQIDLLKGNVCQSSKEEDTKHGSDGEEHRHCLAVRVSTHFGWQRHQLGLRTWLEDDHIRFQLQRPLRTAHVGCSSRSGAFRSPGGICEQARLSVGRGSAQATPVVVCVAEERSDTVYQP